MGKIILIIFFWKVDIHNTWTIDIGAVISDDKITVVGGSRLIMGLMVCATFQCAGPGFPNTLVCVQNRHWMYFLNKGLPNQKKKKQGTRIMSKGTYSILISKCNKNLFIYKNVVATTGRNMNSTDWLFTNYNSDIEECEDWTKQLETIDDRVVTITHYFYHVVLILFFFLNNKVNKICVLSKFFRV